MQREAGHPLPVSLVCGFYGTGKTSVISALIKQHPEMRFAVILNSPYSGVHSLDAHMLRTTYNTTQIVEVIDCSGGCGSTKMRADMVKDISRIIDRSDVDYLFIEATGETSPLLLAEIFGCTDSKGRKLESYCEVDAIVSTVDNWSLCSRNSSVQCIVKSCIEGSNFVVLNKIDLMKPAELREAEATITKLNSRAIVLPAEEGEITLNILGTEIFDDTIVKKSATYGVTHLDKEIIIGHEFASFTLFSADTPFHPQKLKMVLDSNIPQLAPVIRSKGIFWLSTREQCGCWSWTPSSSYKFNGMGKFVTEKEKRQEIMLIHSRMDGSVISRLYGACLVGPRDKPPVDKFSDWNTSKELILPPLPLPDAAPTSSPSRGTTDVPTRPLPPPGSMTPPPSSSSTLIGSVSSATVSTKKLEIPIQKNRSNTSFTSPRSSSTTTVPRSFDEQIISASGEVLRLTRTLTKAFAPDSTKEDDVLNLAKKLAMATASLVRLSKTSADPWIRSNSKAVQLAVLSLIRAARASLAGSSDDPNEVDTNRTKVEEAVRHLRAELIVAQDEELLVISDPATAAHHRDLDIKKDKARDAARGAAIGIRNVSQAVELGKPDDFKSTSSLCVKHIQDLVALGAVVELHRERRDLKEALLHFVSDGRAMVLVNAGEETSPNEQVVKQWKISKHNLAFAVKCFIEEFSRRLGALKAPSGGEIGRRRRSGEAPTLEASRRRAVTTQQNELERPLQKREGGRGLKVKGGTVREGVYHKKKFEAKKREPVHAGTISAQYHHRRYMDESSTEEGGNTSGGGGGGGGSGVGGEQHGHTVTVGRSHPRRTAEQVFVGREEEEEEEFNNEDSSSSQKDIIGTSEDKTALKRKELDELAKRLSSGSTGSSAGITLDLISTDADASEMLRKIVAMESYSEWRKRSSQLSEHRKMLEQLSNSKRASAPPLKRIRLFATIFSEATLEFIVTCNEHVLDPDAHSSIEDAVQAYHLGIRSIVTMCHEAAAGYASKGNGALATSHKALATLAGELVKDPPVGEPRARLLDAAHGPATRIIEHNLEKATFRLSTDIKTIAQDMLSCLFTAKEGYRKSKLSELDASFLVTAGVARILSSKIKELLDVVATSNHVAQHKAELLESPARDSTTQDAHSAECNIWKEPEGNIRMGDEDSRDGTMTVVAGSFNKLVECLTSDKHIDNRFLKTFITTYQSFTTPWQLFEKLLERYEVDESVVEGERVGAIRMRVCVVLKYWVENQFFDFDEALINRIFSFVDNKLKAYHHTLADRLSNEIKSRIADRTKSMKAMFIKPRELYTDAVNASIIRSIVDAKDVELAQQLTVAEFNLYNKIEPSELLDQAWAKDKLMHRAPNVLSMIHRSNDLSWWVATSIITQNKKNARKKMFLKFVNVAQRLREYNNYQSLMGIILGLNTAAISRLKCAKELPPKMLKKWKKLEELMTPDSAYRNYRQKLHASKPPCIPYLALYLKDLTFVDEGNDNFLAGLINFNKREMSYRIMEELLQYQITPYNFVEKQPLATFLQVLPCLDERLLFDLSLILEPREKK